MDFFRKKNFWFSFLIAVIISGGIFLRFWSLGSIPPGVHYDEAYNGMNALWANEARDWKIFYPENTGREGLHINAIAFFISLFGNDNFGLRFANALWGSLTLIGFFLLLRKLEFSRLSVAVGVFMLSTSFWHLAFSRTAYRAIMVPLVLVWMFYFFTRALDEKGWKKFFCFVAVGLLLGAGFHTYIAFRVVPLIFLILAAAFTITQKNFLRKNWKAISLIAIVTLIAAVPMLNYYAGHYKEFLDRTLAVSVASAQKMTPLQAFGRSLGSHLNAFFVYGDGNFRHNYNNQPLLPAAWSVLFAIGFFISLKEIMRTIYNKIRKKDRISTPRFYVSVLAQSIFWVMLIPGVLSIEGIPHSLRIIGTIPAVFIFAVMPIEYLTNFYDILKNIYFKAEIAKLKSTYRTIAVAFMVLVIFGGMAQAYVYFAVWAKDLRTEAAYERKLYLFGKMIHDLSPHKNNYVITAYNTHIAPGRKQSSIKSAEYMAYPQIKNYYFYRPLDGISGIDCEDVQIVFLESDQWLRDQYRNRCPGLTTERHTFDKKYSFFVLRAGG